MSYRKFEEAGYRVYIDWKEESLQDRENVSVKTAEISIAQEEGIPYFLLKGRANETCVKPKAATSSDKIYNWTWDNLKALINGGR